MKITDEMVEAAFKALPPDAHGTIGTGEMQRVIDAALSASAPEVKSVDITRLPVGTAVAKVGGYPFPGTVVSAFHTLSGQERFVVEATGEDYRGMLHIFNGGQLRAVDASASPVRIATDAAQTSAADFDLIDALNDKISGLRTQLEAAASVRTIDEERLAAAAARVGLQYGCDAPDAMADEIELLRTEARAAKDAHMSILEEERAAAEARIKTLEADYMAAYNRGLADGNRLSIQQQQAIHAAADCAKEMQSALSAISSYLGTGLGDDNTTPGDYEKRIRFGIDDRDRVMREMTLEKTTARISALKRYEPVSVCSEAEMIERVNGDWVSLEDALSAIGN